MSSSSTFSAQFEDRCAASKVNPCISIERSAKAAVVAGNFVEQLNEKNAAFIRELRAVPTNQLRQMRLPGLRDVSKAILDEFCAILPECTKLEELHVSQSRLNPNDVAKILAATPCTTLKRLELLGCGLGEEVLEALVGLIKRSHDLEELKLSDNKFSAANLARLFETLRAQITSGSRIKTLHVGGNKLGAEGMRALRVNFSGMICLTSLGLRGTELDGEALSELAELLRGGGCGIADLQLRQNPVGQGLTREIVGKLIANTSLRVLELQQTGLDANSLKLLADAFQQHTGLRALNLSKNTLGDSAAEALGRLVGNCKSLTTLQLDQTGLSSIGISTLFQYVGRLGVKPALAGLSLSGNRLDGSGLLLLGQAAGRGQLTSLDVSENVFNSDAFVVFAREITGTGQGRLRHLDVSGNALGDKAAPGIEELLQKLQSLQRLYLTDCGLTDVTGQAILRGLASNATLLQLQYGGQTKTANQISKPIRQQIDARVRTNQDAPAPINPPTILEKPPGLEQNTNPIREIKSAGEAQQYYARTIVAPADGSSYGSSIFDFPRIFSQDFYCSDFTEPHFGFNSSGTFDDYHGYLSTIQQPQQPAYFSSYQTYNREPFMSAPAAPPEAEERVQFSVQKQERKKYVFKDHHE